MADDFQPLSFYDNIAAATTALGFKNVGVIWGLAKVPWRSVEDRDGFLAALTQRDYFNVIETGDNG